MLRKQSSSEQVYREVKGQHHHPKPEGRVRQKVGCKCHNIADTYQSEARTHQ